ncbi:hypothetical protein GCM10008969_01830 [Pseudomonas veronii subsp. inensis]
MQFHWQAEVLRSDEHPLDLRRRKRQVLAKRIYRVHQPFSSKRRKHFAADVINVVIDTIRIFRWQGVRRQAGATHADRQLGAETADHPQDLAFTG